MELENNIELTMVSYRYQKQSLNKNILIQPRLKKILWLTWINKDAIFSKAVDNQEGKTRKRRKKTKNKKTRKKSLQKRRKMAYVLTRFLCYTADATQEDF